jgi:hypothetical protein
MINRRDFGKLVLGATALSFTACNSLASGLSTIPANKKRVVIVGGGFVGVRTDLLNVSAKPHAFPFGAATATPTVYKMSGQTVQGLPVEYNIEVVLSTMNIVSKNVRKVGSISVDQVVFPKVHFYKDHVFSYTKDKVFAFNPSKGESPSLSDKKVSVCKFVHNGWGTHRYIDRFDKFIEGGLGDYIIQLGARRDE